MEKIIFVGEHGGFWKVTPNEKLVFAKDVQNNYVLTTNSGLVVVKNICFNDDKKILDKYLQDGDMFVVSEIRGNAVCANLGKSKKVDLHQYTWNFSN